MWDCCLWLERSETASAPKWQTKPPGCKFLVNGEPTENRVAIASKGALRVEVIAEGGWRTRLIPS